MATNGRTAELDLFPALTGCRKSVIMAMYEANQLNDDNLPPDKMDMFLTKPFSEWSSDMQVRLLPYGAGLIN